MYKQLKKCLEKIGQPPGTPSYTGEQFNIMPLITVTTYNAAQVNSSSGHDFSQLKLTAQPDETVWINIEGLHDINLINQIANHYQLHPLTIEDILNVQQRPKIEEFDHYLFISLQNLNWDKDKRAFNAEPVSLILGKGFVLSFQEQHSKIFNAILERLTCSHLQRMRQQGPDYLFYRLFDAIVDQYFVILEGMGALIEETEDLIISSPSTHNVQALYDLKRQMLMLRKAIWPVREITNHLLQIHEDLISAFTTVYLRDVYDHIAQAIDTIEIFRDTVAGMLDVYLSSLTNRMNEVIKVLTIISTIFIPITFIASVYGMNFAYMPELHWRWGYFSVLSLMAIITLVMLWYFKRKKWW